MQYHHNNQEAFHESIPVFFFKIQYTKVAQLLMRLEKSKTKPTDPKGQQNIPSSLLPEKIPEDFENTFLPVCPYP